MTSSATTRAEKFVVRFPNGMRASVAEAAGLSHRSMNAAFDGCPQASNRHYWLCWTER